MVSLSDLQAGASLTADYEELERYFGIVPLAAIPEEKDIRDYAADRSPRSHKKAKKGKRTG